jgi:SET domain-containing protein
MNFNDVFPEAIEAREVDYLYVQESGIRGGGQGLFTSITIYKNELIALFKGKILNAAEAKAMAKLGLDGYFIMMPDGSIMDSRQVKCYAKYANDAAGSSSSSFKNNSKITLSEKEKVCLAATRNIKAGEEIFCDYGKRYWRKQRQTATGSKTVLNP